MAACLPATVADIPALVALENSVFQTDRISRRQFHYLLKKGRAVVVKAVDDAALGETLAGAMVLFFRRDSDRARIYSLAVAPQARRRGIARRLLAYAEAESRRRGMKGVVLEVREDNSAALALYRAAGFQAIGRRLNYYEDGGAAARLGKILAPPEEVKE